MKDDNLISLLISNTNLVLTGLVTLQVRMLDDTTCNPIYNYLSGNNQVQTPTEMCSTSLALWVILKKWLIIFCIGGDGLS